MNCGIDLRALERARSLQREIGSACDWKPIKMNLAHTGDVEILPHKIEMEGASGGWVTCGAAHLSVFVCEMDIGEGGFVGMNLKIGIELGDAFLVGRRIHSVNVPLGLRVGARASDLQ